MANSLEIPFSTVPYPGLRPFQHNEADIFFGREEQIDQLLKKLQKSRFLAVIGPSGCGKSSLVRAGMTAALEAGFLTDAGARWRIVDLRPGEEPMERLANAFLSPAVQGKEHRDDPEATLFVQAMLRRGPRGLIEVLHEQPLPKNANLLLVVDQFEEIFRFRREGGADEADAFVALLLATAAQREVPVYVVITMRSDFLGDCAVFSGLPEAMNESQFLTPRLTREQAEAAIMKPARVFGGKVEPLLVNRLLNDMSSDPDQLPVLQHALMRMWNEANKRLAGEHHDDAQSPVIITLDDYKKVGTLAVALSDHANEVYDNLSKRQQHIAEIMFRQLTERGIGKRDIRRPARLNDVAKIAGAEIEEVMEVVEAFRKSNRSFVMPPVGVTLRPKTMLDIGHESLIRNWDHLNKWADDEARAAVFYRHLKQTAIGWANKDAELWGGVNLERAREWKDEHKPTPEWAARYGSEEEYAVTTKFLSASETQWKAQQQHAKDEKERKVKEEVEFLRLGEKAQEARKFKWLTAALALVVLLLIGAVAWAFQQRQLALSKSEEAMQQKDEAQKKTREALDSKAELEIQVEETKRQKGLAEVAASKAETQEKLARENADEAEKQRKEAENAKQLAEGQRREALRQRGIAERRKRDAEAASYISYGSQLGALAELTRNQQATLLKPSVQLAQESMSITYTASGYQALSQGLALLPRPIATIKYKGEVKNAVFSADGTGLITREGEDSKTVRMWPSVVKDDNSVRTLDENDPASKNVGQVAALSTHGSYQAIVSNDSKTLRVLETATGKEVASLSADKSFRPAWIIFSPDESRQYLAAPDDDKSLLIWDVINNRKVARLSNLPDVPTKTILSANGKYLATASWNSAAAVYNVATQEKVGMISPGKNISMMLFSPDEEVKYLATVREDTLNSARSEKKASSKKQAGTRDRYYQTAQVWEVKTAREVARMPCNGNIHRIALTPDGKYLATGSGDGTARVWEIETGREIVRLNHEGAVLDLVFSKDGQYLATASKDGTARVWEVGTGRETARLIHEDRVNSVAFSPKGDYLVTTSGDQTTRLWKLIKDWGYANIPTGEGTERLFSLSPDGNYLASIDLVASKMKSKLQLRSSIDGRLKWEKENVPAGLIFFSSNGAYLGLLSLEGSENSPWWEISSGNLVERGKDLQELNIFGISPDGQYWIGEGETAERVQLVKRTTGRRVEVVGEPVDQGSYKEFVPFDPTGEYFVSSVKDDDAKLAIQKLSTGEVRYLALPESVTRVVFSQNGQYLAAASEKGTLKIYELKSTREISLANPSDINYIAFSQNGNYIAVATAGNAVHVLEAATGEPVKSMFYEKPVQRVAFSHDSSYLAAASEDNTVRIWEVLTGREVARLPNEDKVKDIAFSQDDSILMIVGIDDEQDFDIGAIGTIAQPWRWQKQDLIDAACARLIPALTPEYRLQYAKWHKATVGKLPSDTCRVKR